MAFASAYKQCTIRVSILALSLGMLVTPSFARSKQDIVIFKNGDSWTCEIQRLDRGYLYVKLDYVDGSVSIDWSKIARVESPQLFVVRTSNGDLLVGPIMTAQDSQSEGTRALTVGQGAAARTLPDSRVVSIEQTERGFLHGLRGDISGGVTYAKSDRQMQVTINSSAKYYRESWSAQAAYDASFSGSQSSPGSLREDGGLMVTRALACRRCFGAAVMGFQRNDEQQLDSRSAVGAGFGYLVRDTDRWRIYCLVGPVWTREKYHTSEDSRTTTSNGEAIARAGLQYFRFKTTNLQVASTSYPSITDPGRVRLDGNATVKFQIVKNLYWNFSVYINYDSKPPHATPRSDQGATSSIGWSF